MAAAKLLLLQDTQRIVARLREFDPKRFQLQPLKAGAANGDVHVNAADAARLARTAALLVGGLGLEAERGASLLWQRDGNALLVLPQKIALTLGEGVLAFSIPVQCDQSGATQVHVSFVVGDPKRPAGLVAVTEERPRGPAVVVDTWGDTLVAFAWHVVLQMADSLAAETGLDEDGAALIPIALYATPNELVVTPMARHAFDRKGA